MAHEDYSAPYAPKTVPEKTLGISKARTEAGPVADLGLGVTSLPETTVDLTTTERVDLELPRS